MKKVLWLVLTLCISSSLKSFQLGNTGSDSANPEIKIIKLGGIQDPPPSFELEENSECYLLDDNRRRHEYKEIVTITINQLETLPGYDGLPEMFLCIYSGETLSNESVISISQPINSTNYPTHIFSLVENPNITLISFFIESLEILNLSQEFNSLCENYEINNDPIPIEINFALVAFENENMVYYNASFPDFFEGEYFDSESILVTSGILICCTNLTDPNMGGGDSGGGYFPLSGPVISNSLFGLYANNKPLTDRNIIGGRFSNETVFNTPKITPNPFVEYFNVELPNNTQFIKIMNYGGNQIYYEDFKHSQDGFFTRQIDASKFIPGLYICMVGTTTKTFSIQLVKISN